MIYVFCLFKSFDFLVFDISRKKITIRIKYTEQLLNFSSLFIMKPKWELSFNENSTFADVENFFQRAIPMFSVAGVVFTLNQLFKTISSDPSKSVLDIVEAFEVSPPQASQDESVLPPDDPRDPAFDPNGLNMSLVSYYVYYFGGITIFALNDASTATTIIDNIPAGTSYAPNSLIINGVAKTDAIGDDEAEYDFANNRVLFRIGTGANGTTGGEVNPSVSGNVTFKVFTPSSCAVFACNSTISNRARMSYGGKLSLLNLYDSSGIIISGCNIPNPVSNTITGSFPLSNPIFRPS